VNLAALHVGQDPQQSRDELTKMPQTCRSCSQDNYADLEARHVLERKILVRRDENIEILFCKG
jgi:hypothetical protein